MLRLGTATLLEHAVRTLRRAGYTVAIAGLPPAAPAPANLPVVRDRFAERGPLGGIEAALHSLAGLPAQPVLFVAVDLPLLPAAFLRYLAERAQQTGALATLPYVTGKPQPLCAAYSSGLAGGITEALGRNDRKVMRVLRGLMAEQSFDSFRVEAVAAALGWESPHPWFLNINTPRDWQAVEQLAAGPWTTA